VLSVVVAGIGDPGGKQGERQHSNSSASPMPATDEHMHRHLRRLERVWIDWPIYFITTCTFRRRAILASKRVASILIDEWRSAHNRHGWAIGRYVIMPDHVHFFCSAELGVKRLATFMQAWKQWTSKRIAREVKLSGTVWQEEFFDHVLRSSESYSQKWDYVKGNPVRAGLVKRSDEWPWQGEIESLML
jgi:REP element-mobilizing transposase RayT